VKYPSAFEDAGGLIAMIKHSKTTKFIKWYDSKQARSIAEDKSVDVAAKTEKLGQLMFGDLWTQSKAQRQPLE
jgi:hypothetical protein